MRSSTAQDRPLLGSCWGGQSDRCRPTDRCNANIDDPIVVVSLIGEIDMARESQLLAVVESLDAGCPARRSLWI
jgi:hypothetical protein